MGKVHRESSLTNIKLIADGSHKIWLVTFRENNESKFGYFKKLEPDGHFPELLAKISVATSAFKTSFQGSRSATEYLVLDDNNKIVGILSASLKEFKRFNFAAEPRPSDDITKELVIPSSETLIKNNTIELLFGRFFLGDDDLHPHNLSLQGDIDFDMFWYWFVIYMKGSRPALKLPLNRVNITVRDYERFPCIEDFKPYHWPTYTHPGQLSIAPVVPVVQKTLLSAVLRKVYPDPQQFINLASDSVAQEQKVAAALKILVTFQPKLLRRRLTALFGDTPLNYKSLNSDICLKYEHEFPALCNAKTNENSFVEFIMTMYQQHYDNLYRVVVFYMGSENNGFDVKLLATNMELYKKPSLYQNILTWVSEENKTTYADEPDYQYNLNELENRYHQIWRDSHALKFKSQHDALISLTNELCRLTTGKEPIETLIRKDVIDQNLTHTLQLFGSLEKISIKIESAVDKETDLYQALALLVNFTNEFQQSIEVYFKKECTDLNGEDNQIFVERLEALCSINQSQKLSSLLAHTTTYASKFINITKRLVECVQQIKFNLHLLTSDECDEKVLSLNHEQVFKGYNDALFKWVDSLDPQKFNEYILTIIKKKYAPTIKSFSMRWRATPVSEYIGHSKEKNSNKLAYILSSSSDELGALNTEIIRELTPMMLVINYLPSISAAYKNRDFELNIAKFVTSAAAYAKTERFIHLYNPKGIELFFKTLYAWVETLPGYKRETTKKLSERNRLTCLVDSALENYEKNLLKSFWKKDNRSAEIQRYFCENSSIMALALTFVKGNKGSTASQSILYNLIVEIKKDIVENPKLINEQGYKLIDAFMEDNLDLYMRHIKGPITHEILEKDLKKVTITV